MANNAQKVPFQSALNRFAEKKVRDAIQQIGKALPCSVTAIEGQIVTVKFELDSDPFTLPEIKIPVLTFEYIRYPIQVGDKGMTVAADVRLGGISGLGEGTPTLVPSANLTMLAFIPVANSNWSDPPDPDKLDLNGPAGVTIRAKDGTAMIEVTDTEVRITGTLVINGDQYLSHKHSGVQTGGGTSGGVVP
jgi:hypothetical protein